MFCANCGHDNPDGAKFCGNCRNSFGTANEPIFSDGDLPQENEIKNGVGAKISYILLFIWGGLLMIFGVGQGCNWDEYPQEIKDQLFLPAILFFTSGILIIFAGYIRLKVLKFLSIGTNKATILLAVIGFILFIIGASTDPTFE